VLVAGLYVAVVTVLGAALGTPVPIGPGLVAAAVVAVVFAPARSRVQHRVDRLVYGERRNPYRVMTQLGERLHSERDADELTVVVRTVQQALKLPYAGIVDPDGRVLAETGEPGPATAALPLSYQGVAMGELVVCPHDERGFDRDVRALLDDLALQVGAAVHAVSLSSELQASRHRLVSAKEEERRRLRRDLHDGLGPQLAALGLKLDTAHALAETRPEASKAVLGGVKDDIRRTIDDIRRLVYGLRPPALDELGLVAAVRECGTRFDHDGSATPRITVSAPEPLPALPAAVEVAAYWIANEALTNVVRHAHARHCRIDLWLEHDRPVPVLHVLVSDDGTGPPADWRPGVGTESMRERAAELGGAVHVGPAPDGRGTVVHASIPCEPPATDDD
jgi:signal transduction histidine kinase